LRAARSGPSTRAKAALAQDDNIALVFIFQRFTIWGIQKDKWVLAGESCGWANQYPSNIVDFFVEGAIDLAES